jgi:hypothetical protein
MKNQTLNTLSMLEHDVVQRIGETMYAILDNGDRPDKRIDAIIGLNFAMKSIMRTLDKVSTKIVDAP